METGVKQKEMKKSVRYVPSRYKQAAEKISAQSSNSRGETFLKGSSDSQGLCSSSQDTASYSKLSVTQESQGLTSTPTSKEFPVLLLDESVVNNAVDRPMLPHLKRGYETMSANFMKRDVIRKIKSQNETLLQGPVIVSHNDKKKNEEYNENLADAEMDLIYSQYIQMIFLEGQCTASLESRASDALKCIHQLLCLVLLEMNKARSQRCSLHIVLSIIRIHEHCEQQERILHRVFRIVPSLEEQYKKLAEAVSFTKHKLHIKDVLVPDYGSEGEVIDLLERMGDFIFSFFQEFRNAKEINESADGLQSYILLGKEIAVALQRGLKLLTDVKDLTLSEACLM